MDVGSLRYSYATLAASALCHSSSEDVALSSSGMPAILIYRLQENEFEFFDNFDEQWCLTETNNAVWLDWIEYGCLVLKSNLLPCLYHISEYPEGCINLHCAIYPSRTLHTSISPSYALSSRQTSNFLPSFPRFKSHMSKHAGHKPCKSFP